MEIRCFVLDGHYFVVKSVIISTVKREGKMVKRKGTRKVARSSSKGRTKRSVSKTKRRSGAARSSAKPLGQRSLFSRGSLDPQQNRVLVVAGVSLAVLVLFAAIFFFRSASVGQAVQVTSDTICEVGHACFVTEGLPFSEAAAEVGDIFELTLKARSLGGYIGEEIAEASFVVTYDHTALEYVGFDSLLPSVFDSSLYSEQVTELSPGQLQYIFVELDPAPGAALTIPATPSVVDFVTLNFNVLDLSTPVDLSYTLQDVIVQSDIEDGDGIVTSVLTTGDSAILVDGSSLAFLEPSFDPRDGDMNVPLDMPITVQFDREVFFAGAIEDAFVLRDPFTTKSISASYDSVGHSVVITAVGGYDYETEYSLEVRDGQVYDALGITVPVGMEISFTTQPSYLETVFSPEDGASDVAVGASLQIDFEEELQWNFQQLDEGLFLQDADGADIPFSASYNGQEYTFILDPASDLDMGTTYTYGLSLPEEIIGGVSGDHAAPDSFATFTTTPAPVDTTPPGVDFWPGQFADGVPLGTVIALQFDESVESIPLQALGGTSVSLSTFSDVSPILEFYDVTRGRPVLFSARYGETRNAIFIEPRFDLKHDTVYAVILKGDYVQDLSGNVLTSDQRFAFRTESEPAVVPAGPIEVIFNPTQGSSDVSVEEVVYITFDREMELLSGASIDSLTDYSSLISFEDALGNPVDHTVLYDAGTMMFSVDPVADLGYDTQFVVTLAGDELQDLSGQLLGEQTLSFTSEADPAVACALGDLSACEDEASCLAVGGEWVLAICLQPVDDPDGDGVVGAADLCPLEYAETVDGCPEIVDTCTTNPLLCLDELSCSAEGWLWEASLPECLDPLGDHDGDGIDNGDEIVGCVTDPTSTCGQSVIGDLGIWFVPEDGSVDVGVDEVIEVHFDEEIRFDDLSKLISFTDASGSDVASDLQYSETTFTVTVDPVEYLANDALYTLTVFADFVEGKSGADLPGDQSMSFTTGPDTVTVAACSLADLQLCEDEVSCLAVAGVWISDVELCDLADGDFDLDGVLNADDLCPSEYSIEADGCPLPDSLDCSTDLSTCTTEDECTAASGVWDGVACLLDETVDYDGDGLVGAADLCPYDGHATVDGCAEVSLPPEFYTVSVTDAAGVEVSGDLLLGGLYTVEIVVAPDATLGDLPEHLLISQVLVDGSSEAGTLVSQHKDALAVGGSETLTYTFTADGTGDHQISVFIWSDWISQGGVVLADSFEVSYSASS